MKPKKNPYKGLTCYIYRYKKIARNNTQLGKNQEVVTLEIAFNPQLESFQLGGRAGHFPVKGSGIMKVY